MEQDVRSILATLKTGKFDPIYVLQGEEPYFIDQLADYIHENALEEKDKAFNLVVLYGKDTPVATLLNHARRFPMMSERQVVIVREAQDIPDLNRESGSRLFLDYLMHPVPSTILVVCHKYKTFDKRRELGKKIAKLATTLNSKKLYDNQLPDFIRKIVSDENRKIDDEAVLVCCEYIGTSLSRIANELHKIAPGIAAGAMITGPMVMEQVGVSREFNIFELQRAIVSRNHGQAHQIAAWFESNTRKNPIIPVVAYLYSFFARLMVASTVKDKSRENLLKVLKISPYSFRDYSTALGHFSVNQIRRNLSSLKAADLALKGVDSSTGPENHPLRELVFKLLL